MALTRYSRRDFVRTCSLLGAGLGLFGPCAAVQAATGNDSLSRTAFLMNTMVTMTVRNTPHDLAVEAMSLAQAEMERLIPLLSRFHSASPLFVLNEQGSLHHAPDALLTVLEHGLSWNSLTRGAFDPTVLPLLRHMEECRHQRREVLAAELSELLELVDASGVSIQGRDILLSHSQAAVTLDGIAKGYIADQAAQAIRSAGVREFLINAGGDIICHAPHGTAPWRIAIEDPALQGNPPEIISLTSGALATSGSYEIYFSRDRSLHHIIDPSRGVSPQASLSASVRASTVMEADLLATSAFVMPPAQALAFIGSLPGRECLILDRNMTPLASPGWG